MSDDDLIGRLGRELGEAAERQAAGRRGPRAALGRQRAAANGDALMSGDDPRRPEATDGRRGAYGGGPRGPVAWLRRRSGRTLLLAGGVTVALAGVGGAAGLLAGRGEVGGPPTLTYARLTPEQRAAGLSETTRPVVIGRGRGRHSGWAWQLVAFQTTSGLCIAIDFPAIENIGGGCAVDVPREGRPIDWQGYLDRLGSRGPSTLLGAVRPDAARVTLAHGYRDRRVAEEARLVRVDDPQILDAIGVTRPFALWVGEVTDANPIARAVSYDAAGRELGAVGVPNGGAGSGGFLPRGCELPKIEDASSTDAELPLPSALADALTIFQRPQRTDDRPAWLVRRLFGRGDPRGPFAQPFLRMHDGEIDLGALRRTGTAPDGRPLFLVVFRQELPQAPDGCLHTATPRLQREAERQRRLSARASREVHVLLVDSRLRSYGGMSARSVNDGISHAGGFRLRSGLTRVSGIVPDGVATVELTFANGVRRVVPIRGNALIADVPVRAVDALGARQVLRDRDGSVVATVKRRR